MPPFHAHEFPHEEPMIRVSVIEQHPIHVLTHQQILWFLASDRSISKLDLSIFFSLGFERLDLAAHSTFVSSSFRRWAALDDKPGINLAR